MTFIFSPTRREGRRICRPHFIIYGPCVSMHPRPYFKKLHFAARGDIFLKLQRMVFVEATVEFYKFLKICRAILMVLVIWAMFFKSEWCRKHPKIWSGDRLVNILGCDKFCCL